MICAALCLLSSRKMINIYEAPIVAYLVKIEGTNLRAERWSIHGKFLPFPNVEWPRHTGSELEPGIAIPDVRAATDGSRVIVR
jgi:hypothetical protein